MKKTILVAFLITMSQLAIGQDIKKADLYNPYENVDSALSIIQKQAAKEGKHVLIQIGGNWCGWCIKFNQIVKADPQLDSLEKANYIVYHLNYSKENKNSAALAKYGFPQRFGFPVFIILNSKGKQIHTQNSSYLEQDKGYSKEKVKGFFQDWGPGALDPKAYLKY
jgi:thioredoxin-related protein